MSINGAYDISVHTPAGDRDSHLTLHSDGHHLTGEQCVDHECQTIHDGAVNGEHFEWSAELPGTHAPLHFTAKCDDHACTIISGDVHVEGVGDFHFTGHKS